VLLPVSVKHRAAVNGNPIGFGTAAGVNHARVLVSDFSRSLMAMHVVMIARRQTSTERTGRVNSRKRGQRAKYAL
jgi:hypothetical protein